VTLRASPAALTAQPADTAAGASVVELRTPWGVVLGGSLHGDVVIASTQALALVKAGLLVRAFVIAGLATMTKTVTLGGGRTLILENGIYRIVR
jgi:uncharacterized SAM-binding protein YcdF (DUF218 family)